MRDGIRDQLLDPLALDHLEGCGSINWNRLIQWQYRSAQGGQWAYINDMIAGKWGQGVGKWIGTTSYDIN